MPTSGSQVILCDVPIRFDTYIGCSHGCAYCFTQKKYDNTIIKKGETVKALKHFVSGCRTILTKWCDFDIPIHWGGMSDPFQPIEKEMKKSLECLEYLSDTKYPFIFSTKGILVTQPDYLELLKNSNCVGQVSITQNNFIDKYEKGAPNFNSRIEMIEKLAPVVKRLIVRIQPYLPYFLKDVLEYLDIYQKCGVYGVTVEGLKNSTNKNPTTEKVAGDYCIPKDILYNDFVRIKEKCHELEIKFFAGENRLRNMGDSLCCCGCEGLNGFKVHKGNLNHIYFGTPEFTEASKKTGSADVFKALSQEAGYLQYIKGSAFYDKMISISKTKAAREIYGL
jgi:DNA repair photolyase